MYLKGILMKYPLKEGTLTIPDHWRDDSINIFTISESQGINLVINRQQIPATLPSSEFLNEQLNSFSDNLEHYQRLNKQRTDIDGAIGITVEYTYKSPEGIMHQLTTLLAKEQHFLSLTITQPETISDAHKKEFMNVIGQFRFTDGDPD